MRKDDVVNTAVDRNKAQQYPPPPPIGLLFRLAYGKDWYGATADNFLGGAAEQSMGYSRLTVGRHDHQINALFTGDTQDLTDGNAMR